MSEEKWPESVPVFTAAMIERGKWGSGDCHCALGWLGKLFGGGPNPSKNSPGVEYWKALSAVRAAMFGTGYLGVSVITWNDSVASKAQVASVLNKAMRALGYTEIEEVEA